MTALMGSSGAGAKFVCVCVCVFELSVCVFVLEPSLCTVGKTTLLDVISGRKTGGSIRGTICINGHKVTCSIFEMLPLL